MTSGALYQDLVSRGFAVEAKDAALYVTPRASLTAADVDAIKRAKDELLLWVRLACEQVKADEDEYGPRLNFAMSDALYVAIANHRRAVFLAMKADKASEMEEA